MAIVMVNISYVHGMLWEVDQGTCDASARAVFSRRQDSRDWICSWLACSCRRVAWLSWLSCWRLMSFSRRSRWSLSAECFACATVHMQIWPKSQTSSSNKSSGDQAHIIIFTTSHKWTGQLSGAFFWCLMRQQSTKHGSATGLYDPHKLDCLEENKLQVAILLLRKTATRTQRNFEPYLWYQATYFGGQSNIRLRICDERKTISERKHACSMYWFVWLLDSIISLSLASRAALSSHSSVCMPSICLSIEWIRDLSRQYSHCK